MKKFTLKKWYPSLQKKTIEGNIANWDDDEKAYTVIQNADRVEILDKTEVENNPDFWELIKEEKPLFTTEDVQNKIEELVENFLDHVNPYIGSEMLSNTYDDNVILWRAKKCALITVNEILVNTPMYTGNLNPKWSFWNEVRIELAKERVEE